MDETRVFSCAEKYSSADVTSKYPVEGMQAKSLRSCTQVANDDLDVVRWTGCC